MKKVVFLVMVVLVTTSTISFSQRAKIRSGDKNNKEIKKSIKIFRNQISAYQDKVDELRAENKKMIASFESSTDTLALSRYSGCISENNSLISWYVQQISYLEDRSNNLIVATAGDEDQNYFRLRGDAQGAADAYLLITYADKIKSGGWNADSMNLRGRVVNNWYYPVTAIVEGPGKFYREFHLKANNGSASFQIPFPGYYTTTFISSTNERKYLSKKVGPNIIYYDDKGNVYDYMATLPRY